MAADSPTWPHRREIYIDARDLQSDSDPDNPLTPEEYTAVLQNRGLQKLAENQLVKSFAAVIRTVAPTYALGEDFQLGDTITMIDANLGVTVDAVVQGVTHSVSREGEQTEFTFGYGQPTIYDTLRKAAK